MRELTLSEIQNVQGAGLASAILIGASIEILAWMGIVYSKDASYQLYKPSNYAIVGSTGAAIGAGVYYFA